jgi:hypothetical protein
MVWRQNGSTLTQSEAEYVKPFRSPASDAHRHLAGTRALNRKNIILPDRRLARAHQRQSHDTQKP